MFAVVTTPGSPSSIGLNYNFTYRLNSCDSNAMPTMYFLIKIACFGLEILISIV